MKYFIYISLVILLLYSCSKKDKVYRYLHGSWLIEEIYYKNHNLAAEYLSNDVYFEENYMGYLPKKIIYNDSGKIDWEIVDKINGDITWDLIVKDTLYYIKFFTNDEVFKDTLLIKFYREGDFFVMNLTNKNTYIKLSKFTLTRIPD
ncbi:MAG: hypothetical protein OHK0036_09790 [Bacteroidia bacterium]